MDKNPFSLYDFLGYFIPGAFSLYLIIFSQNSNGIFSYFEINNIKKLTNEVSIIYIIFFTIISYIIGHLLSFISTLTIENFTIWLLGFPSKNLLGKQKDKYFSIKRDNSGNKLKFQTILSYIFRSILIILLFPISVFVFSIGFLLGLNYTAYSKKIGSPYINIIENKLINLFSNLNIALNLENDDFHKYLIHYCYDKCLSHQSKLMNYVALYGFLRVICLILNFWCIYQLYNLLLKYKLDLVDGSLIPFIFFILNCFLAYITYLSYLKFYRRYSQENLMVLLLIKDDNIETNTI